MEHWFETLKRQEHSTLESQFDFLAIYFHISLLWSWNASNGANKITNFNTFVIATDNMSFTNKSVNNWPHVHKFPIKGRFLHVQPTTRKWSNLSYSPLRYQPLLKLVIMAKLTGDEMDIIQSETKSFNGGIIDTLMQQTRPSNYLRFHQISIMCRWHVSPILLSISELIICTEWQGNALFLEGKISFGQHYNLEFISLDKLVIGDIARH